MSKVFYGLIVVALVLGIWFRLTHRAPTPLAALAPVAPAKPAQKVDYAALAQAPRPAVKKTAELSPECQELWDGLNQLNLRDLSGFPPKTGVPNGSACKNAPAEFNKVSADYQKLCGDLPALKDKVASGAASKKDWVTKSNQCYGVLVAYRAQITDYETRDIPLSQITDPGVLTDKMMAEFATSPGSAADAADRLLELDDKNFNAAKTSAVARFADVLQNGTPNPNDPKWAAWEKSVDRAREMATSPNEKLDLSEMAAVGRVKSGNLEGADQIGEELINEYPDRGLGYYIKSGVAWKGKDMRTAQQYIDKAIAVEGARSGKTPTEDYSRFKVVGNGVRSGATSPYIFHFSTPPNQMQSEAR